MPGKAAKVVISETQQSVLEEIAASRTAAVRLVQRVKIILLAFRGLLNEQISSEVGLNPDQVGTWRRRWQQSFESLIAVECNEGRTALRPVSWRIYVQGEEAAEEVRRLLAAADIQTTFPEREPALVEPPLFAFFARPDKMATMTSAELEAILTQDERVKLAFEEA